MMALSLHLRELIDECACLTIVADNARAPIESATERYYLYNQGAPSRRHTAPPSFTNRKNKSFGSRKASLDCQLKLARARVMRPFRRSKNGAGKVSRWEPAIPVSDPTRPSRQQRTIATKRADAPFSCPRRRSSAEATKATLEGIKDELKKFMDSDNSDDLVDDSSVDSFYASDLEPIAHDDSENGSESYDIVMPLVYKQHPLLANRRPIRSSDAPLNCPVRRQSSDQRRCSFAGSDVQKYILEAIESLAIYDSDDDSATESMSGDDDMQDWQLPTTL
jgi:hypothetical protein